MSADSLVVLPTFALESSADLEHRPQQNRHWVRHRLRWHLEAATLACVPVCLCEGGPPDSQRSSIHFSILPLTLTAARAWLQDPRLLRRLHPLSATSRAAAARPAPARRKPQCPAQNGQPARYAEQRDRVSGYQDIAAAVRGEKRCTLASSSPAFSTHSISCLSAVAVDGSCSNELTPAAAALGCSWPQTRLSNAVVRQLAQSSEILAARSAHYDHGVWR